MSLSLSHVKQAAASKAKAAAKDDQIAKGTATSERIGLDMALTTETAWHVYSCCVEVRLACFV